MGCNGAHSAKSSKKVQKPQTWCEYQTPESNGYIFLMQASQIKLFLFLTLEPNLAVCESYM